MSEGKRRFRSNTQLSNDTTGRRYPAGDELTTDDFSLSVLEHWAKIGVVVDLNPPAAVHDEPEAFTPAAPSKSKKKGVVKHG